MIAEAKKDNSLPEFSIKGEPNYDWHRQPKSFVDELISKGKLAPGIECWILLVIERHTWGAAGKPEYLRASYTELAKLCHVPPQALADRLKRLESAGIITSVPKGEPQRLEKRGYRLTPERWDKVKAYRDPDEVKDRPKTEIGRA